MSVSVTIFTQFVFVRMLKLTNHTHYVHFNTWFARKNRGKMKLKIDFVHFWSLNIPSDVHMHSNMKFNLLHRTALIQSRKIPNQRTRKWYGYASIGPDIKLNFDEFFFVFCLEIRGMLACVTSYNHIEFIYVFPLFYGVDIAIV